MEGGNQLHALFHRLAHKAAIGAAGGAEGDAHIETDIPGTQGSHGLQCFPAGIQAEGGPGGTDVIVLDKSLHRLLLGQTFVQQSRQQLAGANAGEGAPGRLFHAAVQGRAVDGVFDQPLPHPVGFQRLGIGREDGGCPAPKDLAGTPQGAAGGGIAGPPAEADFHPIPCGLPLRVFGPLLREHGQQHLLHGVFIVMPVQIKSHGDLSAYIKVNFIISPYSLLHNRKERKAVLLYKEKRQNGRKIFQKKQQNLLEISPDLL